MLWFFRLVRWPNLLIVALTQYIIRYLIIEPILMVYNFELQLTDLQFMILVLSTVLITAAGYVINDYFDIQTDRLNKPSRIIVGKEISRRTAMTWHNILNLIGIGLGTYVAFVIKIPILSLTFILTSGILWFYSTTYKRQLLVGNIIVALLTALVPLIIVIFELPVINKVFQFRLEATGQNLSIIFYWVLGFAFFAFNLTLIREIIKDIEDFEGDKAFGRNTLPIALGTKNTIYIISALIVVTILSLLFVYFRYLLNSPNGEIDIISLIYIFMLLIIPLIILLVLILMAKEKKHFKFASLFTKIIMLSGLLYAFVFRYIVMSSL